MTGANREMDSADRITKQNDLLMAPLVIGDDTIGLVWQ
jgi:hypothetical protein